MAFFQGCVRRKQVDSRQSLLHGHGHGQGHQLSRSLSVLQLIPIGVGSTIGAGVYVLIGTVAREHSGPALTISFLIAGIAAALSAFCYAELASRCPSAGSAYHYSYICVGEGIAWLIGWALILEYTVGGSTVARGIAPNLSLLFGGEKNLPSFLGRQHIPGTDIIVDPCAAILVIAVTILLCLGIKESAVVQATITYANVCVMLFVIVAGSIIGFQRGWPGYELPSGYFPFGINGMLNGAATVFFSYIGFDTVASTAEEVKNPQRDLPLGIAIALFICGGLYMLVSLVVLGIVPYYLMNPDTPISSAFADQGMSWAVYVVTAGALAALSSTLLGSILPQPRILMAMARDGLLPEFFSQIHNKSSVPVNSTIVTGLVATLMAFFMSVDELAGMVSVGTLLAFTVVAISILILRYVPPDEVPVPVSLLEPDAFERLRHGKDPLVEEKEDLAESDNVANGYLENPLILHRNAVDIISDQKRRKAAGYSIAAICIGVFLITFPASADLIPSWMRWSFVILGVFPFLVGSVVLALIEQDEGRHSFGDSGGFMCPFVPFVPILCILINAYLVLNLGLSTWIRVTMWLVVGMVIYIFYGSKNSSLSGAIYMSTTKANEYAQTTQEAV